MAHPLCRFWLFQPGPVSTHAPTARTRLAVPPRARTSTLAGPPHFSVPWLFWGTCCIGFCSLALLRFHARCRCHYPSIGTSLRSKLYARTPTPVFSLPTAMGRLLRCFWSSWPPLLLYVVVGSEGPHVAMVLYSFLYALLIYPRITLHHLFVL
jgi:hypothetical protein